MEFFLFIIGAQLISRLFSTLETILYTYYHCPIYTVPALQLISTTSEPISYLYILSVFAIESFIHIIIFIFVIYNTKTKRQAVKRCISVDVILWIFIMTTCIYWTHFGAIYLLITSISDLFLSALLVYAIKQETNFIQAERSNDTTHVSE